MSTSPVVIVTGASRGIGRHIALSLANQHKARVVITARNNHQLEEVARSIRATGSQCCVVAGDIKKRETCELIAKRALQDFGQIDHVVHNAGTLGPISFMKNANFDQFEDTFQINVMSVFLLTQLTLPHVRERHGSYLFIGTGADAIPGWSAYCASKAAFTQLCSTLAAEEPDVRSLCVRPGVIDTEMQERIRLEGHQNMRSEDHNKFVKFHEDHVLTDPRESGAFLAALALHIPKEWSGSFMDVRDSKLKEFVAKFIRT